MFEHIFGGHGGNPLWSPTLVVALEDLPFPPPVARGLDAIPGPPETKGIEIPMRNLYIRWILPVIALLVIATALALGAFSPTLGAHAASHSKTTTTTSTTKTKAPNIFNFYVGP